MLTEFEVSNLKFSLLSMKEHEGWKQLPDQSGEPFQTWEDFCQYREPFGLGMRVEVVAAIMAERDGRRLLGDVIASVPPLGKHGGDRKGEQGSHRTLKRGETSSYLAQRLNRDRPDIAAAVERGEYTSIQLVERLADGSGEKMIVVIFAAEGR